MMKLVKKLSLALIAWATLSNPGTEGKAQPNGPTQRVAYKVGFLGAPSFPDAENPALRLKWDDTNMQRMKDLGFNTMQLNIAWAYRPYDEALNLEDVVALPKRFTLTPIDLEHVTDKLRTPEKIAARSVILKERLAICKKYGMRTIFHFGAPNTNQREMEPLEQCVMDPATVERYTTLVKDFGEKFPGVDDLLLYTYDQHAWLCSEAGPCPRCHGVPVAERVSSFVNALAQTWKGINPNGTLWWEPWEISAGESFRTMDLLDATAVGLSIHSSIAEVMIANPADRWFKNVLYLAEERHIPVMGEVFMGGPTEEMEPYTHIQCPLSTLRQLRAVNSAGKLKGIKEYYGNVPNKEDPNLRMTGIFFHNPEVGDEEALAELAKPYGPGAATVVKYWKLVTAAIDLTPWDITWRLRRIGYSFPSHLMTAAVLKGASWKTPAWKSTRKATFIVTDDASQPSFWLREDIQLRFEHAALKMQEAIEVGRGVRNDIPEQFGDVFNASIEELTGFRVRLLAYAYHLRETNLADLIRSAIEKGLPVRQANVEELKAILLKDQENQGSAEPIASALKMLEEDRNKFLNTYFLPSKPTGAKDVRGSSITSN
jgi:hypothetical protein